MKTVKIPEPVDIKIENGEDFTFTFFKFIEEAINQYQPFGKPGGGLKQGAKIYDLFDKNREANSVEMEDADFQSLKKAVQGASFNPRYARYFAHYEDPFE